MEFMNPAPSRNAKYGARTTLSACFRLYNNIHADKAVRAPFLALPPSVLAYRSSRCWVRLLPYFCAAGGVISALLLPRIAAAQSAALTYQGRLLNGANLANGLYDIRFTLSDSSSNVVAGPVTNAATTVTNGYFTTIVDFGASAFDGSLRWLELAVRPASSGIAFTPLVPRQWITATPYAVYAATAKYAALATNLTNPTNVASGLAASGSFINSFAGNGTNTSIFSANGQWQFTNEPAGNGMAYFLNLYPSNATVDRFIINFAPGDLNHSMSINLLGNHGVGAPEMFLASGGSLALIPASGQSPGHLNDERRIHFGGAGGANANQYVEYIGSEIGSAADPNVTFSVPSLWRALYWSNGVWNVCGSGATISGFAEPAMTLLAADTNGNAVFRFYDYLDPHSYDGVYWGPSQPRLDIGVGNKGGLWFNGTMTRQRQTGIASANTLLDFSSSECLDLSAGADAISFSTANATGATTNYQKRLFLIRSRGYSPTLSYPAGWCILGAVAGGSLPQSMSSGQLLRLEIESVGPGEGNKLVTASLARDTTFAWDGDALNFLTNANVNITDGQTKSAINQLVMNAKTNGWWNNCDVIYPLVGPSGGTVAQISNACRINLKNPSQFAITWHGAPAFSSNGVTGDAVTAYGDMNYNFSTQAASYTLNSCHLSVYCGRQNLNDWGVLIGGEDAPETNRANLYGATGYVDESGLNNQYFDNTIYVNALGDFRGPIAVVRTGALAETVYLRSFVSETFVGAGRSTGIPDGPCALLARGYPGGAQDRFSNANLRGATVGGGMNQTQWNAFRADWDTFNAALGRQAP